MATLRPEAPGRTRRESTSPAGNYGAATVGQTMPYNLDVVRSPSEVGGPSSVRALRDRGTNAAARIKSGPCRQILVSPHGCRFFEQLVCVRRARRCERVSLP